MVAAARRAVNETAPGGHSIARVRASTACEDPLIRLLATLVNCAM